MDGPVTELKAGQESYVGSPALVLDSYIGTLDRLLALARTHQLDIACISLPDLCDQLAAAVSGVSGSVPLSQQGEWMVMAAWLLQLRSRLLLPADEPAMKATDAEADRLRSRLSGLQEMQALRHVAGTQAAARP